MAIFIMTVIMPAVVHNARGHVSARGHYEQLGHYERSL